MKIYVQFYKLLLQENYLNNYKKCRVREYSKLTHVQRHL